MKLEAQAIAASGHTEELQERRDRVRREGDTDVPRTLNDKENAVRTRLFYRPG